MSGKKESITDALPELQQISDPEMRDGVIEAWVIAFDESEYESLDQLEFGPAYDQIGRQSQVRHVREVTQCAIALADTLIETRGVELNRDEIIAGALVHDITKFYETSPNVEGYTELGEFIPHPHYAIHVLERAGLSRHIEHITLVHTSGSKPQPKTLEATIVILADIASASSIWWHSADELLFNINVSNIQSK